mmetsp:Transcript_11121/g.34523  ORF Transcript_11121/g.34523 Transcript_11121/m.34523 type:complete len:96 (+) Transcript_11121:512-799(+)
MPTCFPPPNTQTHARFARPTPRNCPFVKTIPDDDQKSNTRCDENGAEIGDFQPGSDLQRRSTDNQLKDETTSERRAVCHYADTTPLHARDDSAAP